MQNQIKNSFFYIYLIKTVTVKIKAQVKVIFVHKSTLYLFTLIIVILKNICLQS